jgi:hypothetical protein
MVVMKEMIQENVQETGYKPMEHYTLGYTLGYKPMEHYTPGYTFGYQTGYTLGYEKEKERNAHIS